MNNEEKQCYLYGAAVQGIQAFIFQTNKLKDIVGASELVETICTSLFARQLGWSGEHEKLVEKLHGDENAIVNAAGNIKYVFKTREACENVVKEFPKKVMEFAPGVTISQSVVGLKENYTNEDFACAVQELENSLRAQRNKPMRDINLGLMGIERSRQTGLPVIYISDENKHLDAGTYRKLYTISEGQRIERKDSVQKLCKKSFGEKYDANKVVFNIDDLTDKNDWIAIIHADGNGLGQIVQKKGSNPKIFKQFSMNLDRATREAAVGAFKTEIAPKVGNSKRFPIRPIVLSGDDHTVICRADLAIPYTEAFIKLFEERTEVLLGEMLKDVFNDGATKLTACAGIAFIKSSYPFYYGYQLAESLCDRAKKNTKKIYDFNNGNLPASCLMFHKVQDSFVSSYEEIVRRELTPAQGHSFEFGPYYIFKEKVDDKIKENGKWTVDELRTKNEELNTVTMGSIRSGLRNWMSLMYINPEIAQQRIDRLRDVSGKREQEYINEVLTKKSPYPIYDILTVNTINTQQTKLEEEQR